MRRRHDTLNTWWASLVMVVGTAAPSVGDEPQVYTDIKHEALFSALGIRVERAWGVGREAGGLEYNVDSAGLPVQAHSFRLAVHPSRQAAEVVAGRYIRLTPRGPTESSQFAQVGDLRYAWTSPGGGRLLFLRDNVTIEFLWRGADADALALARQIDQLIQTDRTIAPRGTFPQVPEILSTGVPSTIAKNSSAEVRPEVRGFGDPQKTTVKVFDAGQPLILAQGKAQENLMLHAPADVHPVGSVRLLMVAANEDNVFVAKEFTVNLTD